MAQPPKIKKFCFTLNNYTSAEESAIREYATKVAAFAVIGHEVGEGGTPHLQGFINCMKQTRFTAVKKIMPRAHLELAQGTDEQNLAYCTKQDKSAFIVGEPQRPGKRNDLSDACEKIKNKVPLKAVAVEHSETFVKYHRGLQALQNVLQEPRKVDDPPSTIWLWGAAGVGKTKLAYDQMPHDEIYVKDSTKWWDGYTQQQCILIDDFDGEWPYRDFLRMLDRYPYQGQYKGGYVHINSPIIIITCEHAPHHFWHGNELAQVERRLSIVTHME